MKVSKIGIVAVAILLVVTGIGFGIAQAGGTHSERPISSFEDSSSPYAETRPVSGFEDQEHSLLAKSPSEDMQLENPIETGAIPATGAEESWMKEHGHD
jgi:hypothetical protein